MHCCTKSQRIDQHRKTKYQLKVEGAGPLTYHLGADYYHDPDGIMLCQPKKYIEKLKEPNTRLFNTEPSKGLKHPLRKLICLNWILQIF